MCVRAPFSAPHASYLRGPGSAPALQAVYECVHGVGTWEGLAVAGVDVYLVASLHID